LAKKQHHKRILILTSCTGEKATTSDVALTTQDFALGKQHVKKRERQLREHMLPAESLYTGQQHVRLMRGVEAVRTAELSASRLHLEIWVLSAGYGIVPGERPLAPYECTFQGMKSSELRNWARKLNAPKDFRKLVGTSFDLGLILLGDSYLSACEIDGGVTFGGPTLVFCGGTTAATLPDLHNVFPMILSTPEAKRFSCGLVGLKGEVAGRLLAGLANGTLSTAECVSDPKSLLARLATLSTAPKRESRSRAVVNPTVDHVIPLPDTWKREARDRSLRYFIPEWDDLVDPDYDFLTDTHSGGTGDWSNQVYAHQLLSSPAYDGILVSRIVAEKSKKKAKLINQVGVHRYLRVPRSFPVMGDCGAFGYIAEKEPPYTTADVIDYYTRLDFDYGVSVDHLIVAATDAEKRFRYDLTIANAAAFLGEHRRAQLPWTPIGAVQGWDTASYVDAAKQYVRMGYTYLALGGLVRTPNPEIMDTVRAVRSHIPKTVQLHLFGVARLNAIPRLADLGLTSVDSASMLRKAWLGSDRNYLSPKGWYSAVRIPQSDGCFRAKRLVEDKTVSASQLAKLEADCLRGVRQHAASSTAPSKRLLDLLVEYDTLVAGSRKGTRERIRRTLEDRPWQSCSCSICKASGVEVVIFRGNNRNRRRGFHNTFVFYKMFQRAARGESIEEHNAGIRNMQQKLFLNSGEDADAIHAASAE
jgi:hypothetical protein